MSQGKAKLVGFDYEIGIEFEEKILNLDLNIDHIFRETQRNRKRDSSQKCLMCHRFVYVLCSV